MENKHLKGFHFHSCPGEKHLEPDESSSHNQVLSFLWSSLKFSFYLSIDGLNILFLSGIWTKILFWKSLIPSMRFTVPPHMIISTGLTGTR